MVRWCSGKRCWAAGGGWRWPEPPSSPSAAARGLGVPAGDPAAAPGPGLQPLPPAMVMSAGGWGDGEEGAEGGESCRAPARRAKR